jgi:hypothetical protein
MTSTRHTGAVNPGTETGDSMLHDRDFYLRRYGRIVPTRSFTRSVPRIHGEEAPGGTTTADTKTDDKTDDTKDDKKSDDDKSKTAATKDDDKSKPKVVTMEHDGKVYVLQDSVNELVGGARQEGREAGKKEVLDAAEREKLKKAGNFQKLYEDAEKERLRLEGELAKKTLDETRVTIGAKHGLSETISKRLVGDDEAAIEADAKAVAKELGIEAPKNETKKKTPINTEAGSGSRTSRTASTASTETKDDKKPTTRYRWQSEQDVAWGER